ncbi:hypothetical protein HA402_006410 [Bradysia odoriphaga]|nr:hypothetical protein HA402_006410 [Bradysia odoriphaga]
MSSASPNIQDEDVFKILVATDIHLGVHEKDPMRGNDSFIAFEEILQHAVQNDVDFILLAGDLFHIANPSTNTLQKCMQLLRTYTLGDKQIPFEIKSDQAVNFNSINHSVNYEDPDMNIKYPVFSIHGNHDDPSGFGRLSSLDLLATSGLVNYFGKWTDLTQVQIDPILIKKGETQLALYGLSHIHDNRLARLFLDNKVVLEAPDESSGQWFNLLVLHQNRADRGLKNFLPENQLPDFLHLVVWGHEHDCRIFPEANGTKGFYVSQPGSSVATSLSEGEAIDKHVGLLLIHGTQFRMEPIKLKSVRPFVFDSIHLAEVEEELGFNEGNTVDKVQDFVAKKVEDMLVVAKSKESDHPNQPKEPLIRLRVFYSSEDQLFNAIRFGQQYNQKVANPLDMIFLKRAISKQKFDLKPLDSTAMSRAAHVEEDEQNRVEDIVEKYFEEADPSKSLQVVPTKAFSELCRRLVLNDDDDAAERIISFYSDKACDYLNENMPAEDCVDDALNEFRSGGDMLQAMLNMLDTRGVKKRSVTSIDTASASNSNDSVTSSNLFSSPMKAPTTTATRGRGRGRGARGGAASSSKNDSSTTKTTARASRAAKTPAQPSVAAMFSTSTVNTSQGTSTRTSQRPARRGNFTQYIEDSDSE